MFRSRHRHRLARLHRLHRMNDWGDWGTGTWSQVGRGFGGHRRNRFASWRARRQRGPSAAKILLAGIAAFTFARLMSASNRGTTSRLEKVLLGIGLAAAGTLLLSLRRSALRYRS